MSQSCAVAKSDKFWRATGQSLLAYKRLAATKSYKVWFSCSRNCTLANGAFCLPSLMPARIFHFLATARDYDIGLFRNSILAIFLLCALCFGQGVYSKYDEHFVISQYTLSGPSPLHNWKRKLVPEYHNKIITATFKSI